MTFESCDPGTAAAGGRTAGHVSGIQGLALRKALIATLKGSGIPPQGAVCTTDALLAKLTADRFAVLESTLTRDPMNKAAQLEIQRSIAQVVPGCR